MARQVDGRIEGRVQQWDLLPSWAKEKKMMQINARSDSAADIQAEKTETGSNKKISNLGGVSQKGQALIWYGSALL